MTGNKLVTTSVVVAVISAVFVAILWNRSYPVPTLEDGWWAEGSPRAVDESVRPFRINVPDEVLLDLHERLRNARRSPPPIENSGFNYGFNSKFLEKLLSFWMGQYDWRQQEAYLNSFPHFKTNIEGLDIHFIHVRPSNFGSKKVVPLLMSHGWPGSIVEFLKIIPILTTPREDTNIVFELVVPSLPGYGFSDAARKPGLGQVEISQIFHKLMKRLGFEQYYVHGGDWGSIISTNMATLYPESVKGLHLTMPFSRSTGANLGLLLGSLWPSLLVRPEHVHLSYPLVEKFSFLLRESGYMHLQATKPDSVGIALSDSPAGLAAYILEKFSTWTNRSYIDDEDGGLETKFTLTELLDNVMVYWVTNTITSSMRLYKESMSQKTMSYNIDYVPCVVPTGVAAFPEELFTQPQPLVAFKYTNVVSYVIMPRGGHFGAFEEPQIMAENIWQFVDKVETLPK